MKELWYAITLLLLLGILAGLSNLTPTSAVVANLPPQYDYPTSDIVTHDGTATLDLNHAFFDPDADPLSFAAETEPGITAALYGNLLTIYATHSGEITLTASDGDTITTQHLHIRVP